MRIQNMENKHSMEKKHSMEVRRKRILFSLRSYLSFFLIMAFVITCCVVLFLNELQRATGLVLDEENISRAAFLTFLNVIFLTLICTVIDGIRRRFMVERPTRRIVQAAERIMKGDFSARIQSGGWMESMGNFDVIIGYFNRMAEELSGVETLRTDFIANVSHELKTPLAVIQNYGTMLRQPGLSEERRMEYAKAVTDSSRRLADLVTNILKLNRLENQKIYLKTEVFDLREQLCECLLSFEGIWEEKEIEIDADLEEEVMIESDAELLTLVWNNLFSNALKFTEPGGRVSVKLESEGGYALVRVTDTGCGISTEVGSHIFEKFYQGDTSHATQGNGLGLALVRRVVDIVGGDISVQSQVGKGSTFTVRIRRKGDGKISTCSISE